VRLTLELFGAEFQNPILLAAGTCGFGRELADVLDLDRLGGFVTKSVTLEPRRGNPAPRVAEFAGGMLNSVGLANPGLEATRRHELPWIAANIRRAQVFVSVAGHTVDEYFRLVEGLDGSGGFLGFELNLSCPNDARRDGPPFALDLDAVADIVSGCRRRTDRPLLAKLAPNDLDLARTVRIATEAGADGLTLVNTIPGLLLLPDTGRPGLGAGSGGVSGPALLPVGLRAVEIAGRHTELPLLGVGGVLSASDAVAYARAGAALVQIGTASFADPRAALRVAEGLVAWGRRRSVASWQDLVRRGGGAGVNG
jgi:dihydroorotate dehydrogenase (NAD+) catalytic subunit